MPPPQPSKPHGRQVSPFEDLRGASSVIVVPGLGFDARRNRLGRGGGHYDRFIASARAIAAVLVVGVAYELQHVPSIPAQPWDVPLWGAVTETGLRRLDGEAAP